MAFFLMSLAGSGWVLCAGHHQWGVKKWSTIETLIIIEDNECINWQWTMLWEKKEARRTDDITVMLLLLLYISQDVAGSRIDPEQLPRHRSRFGQHRHRQLDVIIHTHTHARVSLHNHLPTQLENAAGLVLFLFIIIQPFLFFFTGGIGSGAEWRGGEEEELITYISTHLT